MSGLRRRWLLLAGATAGLDGCALFRRRPPPPPPVVRSVLGEPYQAGGVWRYPDRRFDLDETGLAQAFGPHPAPCRDGAPYDPTALIAAHPTLQLPCVARVTNLQTGMQIVLRIDDRGPDSPARLLALTPRAMTLLGPGSDPGVLRVRLEVLEAPSRALADALPGAHEPLLALAAAPTGAVRSESLPPPPGISAEAAGAQPALPRAAAGPERSGPAVPLRLPETLTQVPVGAAELYLYLGAFGAPTYARRLAARLAGLGAAVVTDYAAAPDRPFRVRIGPLASAAAADATLDQALQAGVVDARIVVDQ